MHRGKCYNNSEEAIVLKSKKSFDDPIYIAESIVDNVKKIFKKNELKKCEATDPDVKAMQNNSFMEEWKINFTIY